MKTNAQTLLVGFALAGVLNTFSQPIALPPGANEPVHGTPGVATQRAVLNFAELPGRSDPPGTPPAEAGVTVRASIAAAGSGPAPPSPAPASSFFALGNEFDPHHWPAPPDTMGAVGPSHLMVTLNHGVRIQNRAGGILNTVSLADFWSPLGPFNRYTLGNSTNVDVFDPRVLYDPYENRWITSATGDAGLPGDTGTNTASLFVGVSRNSDPTGNWNFYRIDVDPLNQRWLDHPTLGFNKDWIVVYGTLFTFGNSFVGSQVWALNKTNLYAGGSGLYTTFFRSGEGIISTQPARTYDTNLSTMYLLNQSSRGNNLSALRMYTVGGPVGAEVFADGPLVTTTNLWDNTAPSGFGGTFGPQLGTPNKFTLLGSHVPSLMYRNGSLWAVQTIFVPAGGAATRSAVQWWQISTNGAILQRGLIDDPTGVNFYAFPSLAVNKFNDVLIGYNRFSTNQFASANYSFRAGTDPLNTLRADTVLKAGEASYFYDFGMGRNYWGDYSATVVDPVNDTDLWTVQEFPALPHSGRDQWGTWWGRIAPRFSIAASGVAVTEGDIGATNALFVLTLPYATNAPFSIDFTTRDGSALSGVDYVATNGTATFAPGQTNLTMAVEVLGDLVAELNETFFMVLGDPTNTGLAAIQADATILDDDNVPLTIANASVSEGDTSATNALFTVQLLQPSRFTVTLDYATTNGSALAGLDYLLTNGTLTFSPGETNLTIAVQILGDIVDETNEMFSLIFSNPANIVLTDDLAVGTIVDNDPLPAIAINDIAVREGDTGLADAAFTLNLSGASALPVSVRLSTSGGGGGTTIRVDFVPTNIVVTFPPLVTNVTTTILLVGDTLIETNEFFVVVLNSPTNATIARLRGTCTILDDDFKVTALVADGADVRLSFTTQSNRTYRIERAASLAEPIVWETVPGAAVVVGTGAIAELLDSGGAGQTQRFYRVKLN